MGVLWYILGERAQGIPDFQAPAPIPKFIDAVEAIDEIPSYDSFEPVAVIRATTADQLLAKSELILLSFILLW